MMMIYSIRSTQIHSSNFFLTYLYQIHIFPDLLSTRLVKSKQKTQTADFISRAPFTNVFTHVSRLSLQVFPEFLKLSQGNCSIVVSGAETASFGRQPQNPPFKLRALSTHVLRKRATDLYVLVLLHVSLQVVFFKCRTRQSAAVLFYFTFDSPSGAR